MGAVTDAPLVRKTSTTLSDGRALHYFDDTEPYLSGRATRTLHDPRPPSPRAAAGEPRWDARTGEWVTIAPARMDRTHLPAPGANPLAPSTALRSTEVPAHDYDVVVFENRFPALPRCEVICYSSDPAATVASLPARRMRTVIEAWADRTAELGAADGGEQVFCFENRGVETGVTLTHPHGQIYTYPFVPREAATVLRRAREHRAATGGNLLRERMLGELDAGARVVVSGRHWAAYVPHAARWPVEVEVAPLRDVPDLCALDDDERAELAVLYPELMARLDRYFTAADGTPIPLPYIAAWYQAPASDHGGDFRLHLRIMSMRRSPDRLKYLAGSESAMGAWINDAVPEEIAARLREAAR
ncbi:galactose-1-phosphate uridylyltransferase [Tomitella gaofuii]|uniref:galactose-1-phosphate uridylyltransferase n=1 Tax=Tomitella gaofuii TaxID=2760083 RepID=UPI0015FCBCE6